MGFHGLPLFPLSERCEAYGLWMVLEGSGHMTHDATQNRGCL